MAGEAGTARRGRTRRAFGKIGHPFVVAAFYVRSFALKAAGGVRKLVDRIRGLYDSRAVTMRRVWRLSFIFEMFYTAFYAVYIIAWVLLGKLSSGWRNVAIVLTAVYFAAAIALIVLGIRMMSAESRTMQIYQRVMRGFRYFSKTISLAIAILTLIAGAQSGSTDTAYIAVDSIMIIFSVVVIVVQVLTIVYGSAEGLVRRLPTAIKSRTRVSHVALEWYKQVTQDADRASRRSGETERFLDGAGECIDRYLLKRMRRRLVSSVTSEDLKGLLDGTDAEDRETCEKVLSGVFGYAFRYGYITENPCPGAGLAGGEKPERKRRRRRAPGVGTAETARGGRPGGDAEKT